MGQTQSNMPIDFVTFVSVAATMYGHFVTRDEDPCNPYGRVEYVSIEAHGNINTRDIKLIKADSRQMPGLRHIPKYMTGLGPITYTPNGQTYYMHDHMFRYHETDRTVHIADKSIHLSELTKEWMQANFVYIPDIMSGDELETYTRLVVERVCHFTAIDWRRDEQVKLSGTLDTSHSMSFSFVDRFYEDRLARKMVYVFDDLLDAVEKISTLKLTRPVTIATTHPLKDNNVRGMYQFFIPFSPSRTEDVKEFAGKLYPTIKEINSDVEKNIKSNMLAVK